MKYEVIRTCYAGASPERMRLWRRGAIVEFADGDPTPSPRSFRPLVAPEAKETAPEEGTPQGPAARPRKAKK